MGKGGDRRPTFCISLLLCYSRKNYMSTDSHSRFSSHTQSAAEVPPVLGSSSGGGGWREPEWGQQAAQTSVPCVPQAG